MAKTAQRLKTDSRPLSWKPIGVGGIYCSPACGAGCKRSEYERCVREAKALAKKLGKGWKPRVSENLHWYYSAEIGTVGRRGLCEVSPPRREGSEYTCFLNTNPQILTRHKNPLTAVRRAVIALDEHITTVHGERAKVINVLGDLFPAKATTRP